MRITLMFRMFDLMCTVVRDPVADGEEPGVGTEMQDTTRCPTGFRCESCGHAGSGLHVAAVDVLGATICLTLCPGCRQSGRPPQIMLSTAEKLAAQHQEHLAAASSPQVRVLPRRLI
jgi:hypothetical protein